MRDYAVPWRTHSETTNASDSGSRKVLLVSALAELVRGAALCNDAQLRRTEAGWVVDGDPLEGALLSLAFKAGEDPDSLRNRLHRIDEIPFDAQHRFMATLHHDHEGGAFLVVKGAPERIVGMCTRQKGDWGNHPIDRGFWRDVIQRLASDGQRVIAIATRRMLPGQALRFSDAEDLVLLGVLGLIDPPRDEAVAAVSACWSAGIRAKMITGDHAATAKAIARQLGLVNCETVLTGESLDGHGPGHLRRIALEVDVFARTSP